jgi:hypothetical protein
MDFVDLQKYRVTCNSSDYGYTSNVVDLTSMKKVGFEEEQG